MHEGCSPYELVVLAYLLPGALLLGGFMAVLAMSAATTQMAFAQSASGTTGIDASGNTKSEIAACQSSKSQQDKATCLKEARNAAAAKRAGKLGNDGDFAANALKRCEVFKTEDDKSACKAQADSALDLAKTNAKRALDDANVAANDAKR